jgi:hypothetical protein
MGNLFISSLIESPQSTQRAQSIAIPVSTYEKAASSRFRTRMTRIARIFTDTHNPRVSASSAQSVFHFPSAFICVHLRLIFVSLSDITLIIQNKLIPIQQKIKPSNNNQAHSWLNLSKNKPQINADERRFIDRIKIINGGAL